ncbi:uncharacterized protein LOC135394529 [Ornithodoros turicata]|uniref:uncharacterized protein LOC135394529 n=1 Tax=Ornithodoros turicata TaxID=34597 RepID=UPI003138C4D6
MKYMTTCCCSCCTVETGTKILSILAAISFTIGWCTTLAKTGDIYFGTLDGLDVSQVVFCIIGAVLSVICAVGAFKKQRRLIFPYIVYQVLYMVYTVAFCTTFLVAISANGYGKDAATSGHGDYPREVGYVFLMAIIVPLIVYCILNVYFLFVILSYYKDLEQAECHDHLRLEDTGVAANVPPSY